MHSDIHCNGKIVNSYKIKQAIINSNGLSRKELLWLSLFLDLLGFSWLMENNTEAANDNLKTFNSDYKN